MCIPHASVNILETDYSFQEQNLKKFESGQSSQPSQFGTSRGIGTSIATKAIEEVAMRTCDENSPIFENTSMEVTRNIQHRSSPIDYETSTTATALVSTPNSHASHIANNPYIYNADSGDVEHQEVDKDINSDITSAIHSSTQNASLNKQTGNLHDRASSTPLSEYPGEGAKVSCLKVKDESGLTRIVTLTSERIRSLYHLPQPQAAKVLGIGLSTLKKHARILLPNDRWPNPRQRNRGCDSDETCNEGVLQGEDLENTMTQLHRLYDNSKANSKESSLALCAPGSPVAEPETESDMEWQPHSRDWERRSLKRPRRDDLTSKPYESKRRREESFRPIAHAEKYGSYHGESIPPKLRMKYHESLTLHSGDHRHFGADQHGSMIRYNSTPSEHHFPTPSDEINTSPYHFVVRRDECADVHRRGQVAPYSPPSIPTILHPNVIVPPAPQLPPLLPHGDHQGKTSHNYGSIFQEHIIQSVLPQRALGSLGDRNTDSLSSQASHVHACHPTSLQTGRLNIRNLVHTSEADVKNLENFYWNFGSMSRLNRYL